jgi:hypothetical protein
VGSCQFADAVQRLFLIDIGSPIYVQFPQMHSSVIVLRLQCVNASIAHRLQLRSATSCPLCTLRAAFAGLKMHAKYRFSCNEWACNHSPHHMHVQNDRFCKLVPLPKTTLFLLP